MTSMTLPEQAESFRKVLANARARAATPHFEWYPYDSLGNFVHLERLLAGTGVDLARSVHGRQVLDLGCADGDFAFFLEHLGASVIAVDHPRSNHNNLAGITALKAALDSRVDVRRMDLDATWDLSDHQFEIATALGLLYHLKNPFAFLESLAKCARTCFLSTRVMRQLPGSNQSYKSVPIAYLLSATELNADNSNFWIFTDASLRRLFTRTHWRVLSMISVGGEKRSDPDTLENDERVFCYLQSTWGEIGVTMGHGWHTPEDAGWRWTERTFAVTASTAGLLTAEIYIPEALIEAASPITLTITANGHALEPARYTSPGLYTVTRSVTKPGEIVFESSHALPPDDVDLRERSIIVQSIRIHPV